MSSNSGIAQRLTPGVNGGGRYAPVNARDLSVVTHTVKGLDMGILWYVHQSKQFAVHHLHMHDIRFDSMFWSRENMQTCDAFNADKQYNSCSKVEDKICIVQYKITLLYEVENIMVYYGKPSKACQRCRARKLKVSWPNSSIEQQ